ncbi:MAG TPA: hypothetical protein VF418_02610 [Sphingomonadaceae bacterium]
MKKLILLALAPLAMLGTGAAAQTVVHTRVVAPGVERTVVRTDYRGRHHRWHHRTRRVCNMVWRHHHRVRVCRTTRW